jgi:hypothetical protein
MAAAGWRDAPGKSSPRPEMKARLKTSSGLPAKSFFIRERWERH